MLVLRGSGAIQPLSPPPTSYQSLLGDAAAAARGGAHGGVVLLRAVGVIRKIVIERHAIKLRGGLVHFRWTRCLPPLNGDVGAAVVRFDHALGIVGRDPQIVIVAVRRSRSLVNVRPPSIER